MKHRATTGSRAGRTSRLGLTALVTLALVVSGTGSVASGEPGDAAEQVTPTPATVQLPEQDGPDEAPAPAVEEEVPALEEPASVLEEQAPTVEEQAPTVEQQVPAADPTAPTAERAPVAPVPATGAGTAGATARSVAPSAVPGASGTSAVITVQVGGDRTAAATVGPLAGVRLRLHDGGAAGPASPVSGSWATCVSDAQGECSFVVPQTQQAVYRNGECTVWFLGCWSYEQVLVSPAGVNRDRQFWVVQESAPAGWYSNPALVTGVPGSLRSTPYVARTGRELRAGSTYAAATTTMDGSSGDNLTATGGRWQVSRANPRLPQTCDAGIDVALVLDLSGSVAEAGAVGDLKASAIAFAEALEGTGSRLSLFTFAQNAPRSSSAAGRNYPELMPVDGNLATIRSRISSYTASGGTNWDRGIHQVAQDGQSFDLAIVITDGMATYSGSPAAGPGNVTRLVETEQAIFSANALKARGTRVLAVGVGDGMEGEALNLRAVSGPTAYVPGTPAGAADHVQTGWRELAGLLETLAKGATCQATITVDKVAEPYGGTPGPGAGWTFAATRTAGSGTLTANGPQVTGPTGTVGYTVQFTRPDATAATVRLEERISPAQRSEGWDLSGLTCTANGRPLTVTRTGDGTTVRVAVGDDVTCTFTNTQTREPGVEILKQAWDAPSAAELAGARELSPGSAVTSGSTVTWTYTVRNTGQTPLSDVVVTDDQGVVVRCPRADLAVGDHMVCTGSGPVNPRP
ncbi:conserved repeat domain-containing protein [Georgenia satyanarayanai]|uniref:Conserved repeat domain-containing protein n=1 Tax=Georgenia satyanarayanai TaxID=860221 RepID=A0A2Y9AEC9_9MICO|nr:VWA domain-containing protein [Georgenia satyanarayanai]PYF99680.1 putative repeat protein (TIGR01451 family) [Georgenia satyanarayanai]SSA42525.1 conserved repeat domain-containing protein [Georgenia satyanarayanai]